jgi:hypothetical protein
MNERFKELAEQATVTRGRMRVIDEEKFAELIVWECMDVVKDCDVTEYNDFREGISQEITKHFGVEE